MSQVCSFFTYSSSPQPKSPLTCTNLKWKLCSGQLRPACPSCLTGHRKNTHYHIAVWVFSQDERRLKDQWCTRKWNDVGSMVYLLVCECIRAWRQETVTFSGEIHTENDAVNTYAWNTPIIKQRSIHRNPLTCANCTECWMQTKLGRRLKWQRFKVRLTALV